MDSDNDSDEPTAAKPERKWNGRMTWTLMKRWVTGEQAEMEQEDIDRGYSNLHVIGCWHPSSRSFQAKAYQCCPVEAVS
jgi:hypothetical protein